MYLTQCDGLWSCLKGGSTDFGALINRPRFFKDICNVFLSKSTYLANIIDKMIGVNLFSNEFEVIFDFFRSPGPYVTLLLYVKWTQFSTSRLIGLSLVV